MMQVLQKSEIKRLQQKGFTYIYFGILTIFAVLYLTAIIIAGMNGTSTDAARVGFYGLFVGMGGSIVLIDITVDGFKNYIHNKHIKVFEDAQPIHRVNITSFQNEGVYTTITMNSMIGNGDLFSMNCFDEKKHLTISKTCKDVTIVKHSEIEMQPFVEYQERFDGTWGNVKISY